MRKLCKSISHCPCDVLAGKTARFFFDSAAFTLHQRSKNMPNRRTGLVKRGSVGTDQTAPEYEQSDRSLHCFADLFRHI